MSKKKKKKKGSKKRNTVPPVAIAEDTGPRPAVPPGSCGLQNKSLGLPKRKRSVFETSQSCLDRRTELEKKSKSKQAKISKKEAHVDKDSVGEDGETHLPPLEGQMIDGQMVLIDRENCKVFSTTDASATGARTIVGKVNGDGTVVLFLEEPVPQEAPGPEFPFETDPDDHCESPLDAYNDILPLLRACGKPPATLSIYDPYFCNGAVAKNLESLGFPNVYNRKEDCYKVWASKSRYPNHDILVTNPPYSEDHIEKLIDHITSQAFGDRPWMLLLPQWVHKKEYYTSRTKHLRPFYMIPRKRYVYRPPPSFREAKKSDVHKKSSPFVSMWYIWGGNPAQNERWLSLAHRHVSNCDTARSKSALRDLRRKGNKRKK